MGARSSCSSSHTGQCVYALHLRACRINRADNFATFSQNYEVKLLLSVCMDYNMSSHKAQMSSRVHTNLLVT